MKHISEIIPEAIGHIKPVINLLDLFSGIGGFSEGLTEAGFEIKNHYFSEIDKHAIANYKYNFKNANYVGSVTDVSEWRIERPNIITFGSPCQDFSLAGKRKGMGGERSSLISYAIMAIKRFKPDAFIWENVKGTYSSNNGEDFWAIMQAFANIDGYRCEQQLLNTSWFLPQNRERIYTVGHLTGRSEPGVFPIEKVSRIPIEQEERTETKRQRVWGYNTQANCISTRYYKDGSENLIEVKALTETRTEEAKEIRRQSQKQGRDFSPRRGKQLTVRKDDNANTVTATQGVEQLVLINRSDIRRLTEIECERLQGFPDNWTEYGNYDGTIKTVSKTQRYKMCGNAVSVPAVKEIGKRLLKNFI